MPPPAHAALDAPAGIPQPFLKSVVEGAGAGCVDGSAL
jgi:hypothetical protein